MSIQTLAPVPLDLVAFKPAVVQLPVGNAGQLGELVVANESPNQLIVTLGPDTHTVEGWTSDKFSMPGTTLTVILQPQSAVALGATQQPPTLTAAAVLTFSLLGDAPIPGTYPATLNRQQAAFAQQVPLGNVNAAAGGTATKNFIVPDGTQAIGWLEDQTAPGNPHRFSLSGLSTLTTYFDANETVPGFGDGSGLFVVMVPAKLETAGFSFFLDATGHLACQVDLFAFLSQPTVYVRQNRTDTFAVVGQGPSSQVLTKDFVAQPPAGIAASSVASGATLSIVAAVGGQNVGLLGFVFFQGSENANAQWQLQDTSGNVLLATQDGAVEHLLASGDYHGARLPGGSGVGVRIKNLGANASFISGMLGWSPQ